MSIYTVLIHPDPRLKLVAKAVDTFDSSLSEIIDNMFETMYEYNGIGLAATQVNIQKRIIVMDVPNKPLSESENDDNEKEDKDYGSTKLALINPEVLETSDDLESFEEGCLSVPGQYSSVTRPEKIKFKYQDMNGEEIIDEAHGLLAICIQHEIDHLNGILFIDHISRLKKERIEKKLMKLKKTKSHE